MKLVSGVFLLGWIGSILTVVLFAAELVRTVFSKDDGPELFSIADKNI